MAFNHGLQPGDSIDNGQLQNIFKCSTQGGMRRALKTNTLVIISDHYKSVYEDRWVNGVFHYTGMGLEGDQSLDFAQNKTLAHSNENGVEVYLFEVFESKQYTFIGQVQLADAPYQEQQPDKNNNKRNVWVFPLQLVNAKTTVIPQEVLLKKQINSEKKAKKLTNEELKNRLQFHDKGVGSRRVSTTSYERDPYVSEYAQRRANGVCQLCENPAPFRDKKGKPYLETHHIVWLSNGGEDSAENTVALCPNCHRKMHSLNLEDDVVLLLEKAKEQL